MRSGLMQRLRYGLLLAALGGSLPVLAEPAAAPAPGASATGQGSLSGDEQAQYLDELKRLYPGRKPRQMLLEHCNRLLSSYALRAGYLDTRPNAPRLHEDQLYSLSVSAPGELTVRLETRSDDERRLEVRSQRVSVYGVDPFVRYQCPSRGPACSVRNPFDGSELLVMVRDQKGVSELARALSFLIRDLQKD